MELEYSLDMVRLKTVISKKGYKDQKIGFDTLFNPWLNEPKVQHYKKRGVKDYHHNFVVNDYNMWGEPCSFWVGCEHNSPKINIYGSCDVVVEYNPNKCFGSALLDYLLKNVYYDNSDTEILSFDLAIDIPVNILNVSFNKYNNKKFSLVDNGSDNKTYYFGTRSSDGASKIYNKKRESKLNYELTRYEITYKNKLDLATMCYVSSMENFLSARLMPLRVVNDCQLNFGINGTDRVLILACMEHPEYLHLLSRVKRNKVKEYLNNEFIITYDLDKMSNLLIDFAKSFYSSDTPYIDFYKFSGKISY